MGLIKTLTIEGTTYDIGVKTGGALTFNENYGTLELRYDSSLRIQDDKLSVQLDEYYSGLGISYGGLYIDTDNASLRVVNKRLAVNLLSPSLYGIIPQQIGRGICVASDNNNVNYYGLSLHTTISPEYIIGYSPVAVHRDGPVVLPIDPQSTLFFSSNEYGLVFNSGYLISYLRYNIKVDLTTGEITEK